MAAERPEPETSSTGLSTPKGEPNDEDSILPQPTKEQYNALLTENRVLRTQKETLIRACEANSQQSAISTRLLDRYEAWQRDVTSQAFHEL